eukprot:tig00000743_g3870.t1
MNPQSHAGQPGMHFGAAFNLLARADGHSHGFDEGGHLPAATPAGPPPGPPPPPPVPLAQNGPSKSIAQPSWSPAAAPQPLPTLDPLPLEDSVLSLAACNPIFSLTSSAPQQPLPQPPVTRPREIPPDDPFILALFRICVRASTICNMRHAKDGLAERRRSATARGSASGGALDLAAQEREVDRELEALQREQAEDTRRLATAWAATCAARDDLRSQCSALQQRLGSVEDALVASNNAIVQSAGSPVGPITAPPNPTLAAAAEASRAQWMAPVPKPKEEPKKDDGFFSSIWRMITDSETPPAASGVSKALAIPGVAVEESWNGGVQLTADAWRGFVTERQALIDKMRRLETQLELEKQQRLSAKDPRFPEGRLNPVEEAMTARGGGYGQGAGSLPLQAAAAHASGEELARAQGEAASLKDELKSLRVQLEVLAAQNSELREQRDSVQARLDDLVRLKGRMKELEHEAAGNRGESARLAAEVSRLSSELEQARGVAEERAGEAASARSDLAAARSEAAAARAEAAAAREQEARLAERVASLEREAGLAMQQAEQYRVLAQRGGEKVAELEKDLATCVASGPPRPASCRVAAFPSAFLFPCPPLLLLFFFWGMLI